MRRMLIVLFALAAFIVLPVLASAEPIPGTYVSPSRGGNVLVGRVSVSRQYPNSGDPKVFNGQSWNGSVLGTQWEIQCGVQTTSVPPDYSQFNPLTGTGFIFYNQTFQGGTFTLYADPLVGWGFGSGTLNTTSAVTQVYVMNNIPVSSSFTAVTTGTFSNGCHLDFAMSNGYGVGETSDPPYLTKPATYPAFLAPDCSEADASHQFGIWAATNDIVALISCPVSTESSTWGQIKAISR